MKNIKLAIITAIFTAVMALSAGAADNTSISMSVGSTQAGAGSSYTVYVSLNDVPSSGVSAMDFAISYDNSLITVDSVSSLVTSKVGAANELFDYYSAGSNVNVSWATLGNTYLTGAGNVFAVSGKVLSSASPASKAKLGIVPIERTLSPETDKKNTTVSIGCETENGNEYYNAVTSDGYVTVTANGDVNIDGFVDSTDAAIVLKHVMLDKAIESPYSANAADCAEEYGTLDIRDVIWILRHCSYGGTALDISQTSMNQCSYENGMLKAEDVEMFGIALPRSLSEGESVRIYIRAKGGSDTAFRCWLTDGSGTAYSEGNRSEDIFTPSASGDKFTFTRTAIQSVDRILIKGPVYGTNIKDLEIEYMGIEYISATLLQPATEATTESTTQSPVSGGTHSHSFNDGLDDSFFSISGNLSTSKGTVTYNNETITQCLKMENSTSIRFTAGNSGTLTMVFHPDGSGYTVSVDNVPLTIPDSGIISVAISGGEHTVKKLNGSSNLFYISVS